MATFSSEELARKVLAMYERERSSQVGQVLSQQDVLAQWPKGFTPVELTTALEFACSQGWLERTETGFALTKGGVASARL